MSIDSGSNEELLDYDDIVIKARQGDLLQSSVIEDRVYLVLDKKPTVRGSQYLKLLSPEGETLRGWSELWADMLDFYYKDRQTNIRPPGLHYSNLKFYIIQSER